MLPRDPRTNCIYSVEDNSSVISDVGPNYRPRAMIECHRMKERMLVTLEPFDTAAMYSVFCFWYNGRLLVEIGPHSLLEALLQSSVNTESALDLGGFTGKSIFTADLELSSFDLLDLRKFKIHGHLSVIIKGLEDAAWVVYALGCVYCHEGSSHIFEVFMGREGTDKFIIKVGNGSVTNQQQAARIST